MALSGRNLSEIYLAPYTAAARPGTHVRVSKVEGEGKGGRGTHLPALAEPAEALALLVAHVGEEVAVDHGVQEPVPVFLRHIRHEPCKSLSVEAHLRRQTTLNQEIGYDRIFNIHQSNAVFQDLP